MPESSPNAGFRFFAIFLAALLAGGLAGWIVLQWGSYFAHPPELVARVQDYNVSQEDAARFDAMSRGYLLKNTALCGAISGLLLAGLIGLGAGAARSARAAVRGLVVGTLLGGLLGGLGGLGGAATWQYLIDNKLFGDATKDTAFQAAIGNTILWASVGLAAGVAAGLGEPNRKFLSGAIAGLSGGALAAWLFLVVAALAFPMARTGQPIPEYWEGNTTTAMACLAWTALPAVCIGLLTAMATAAEKSQPAREEAPPSNDA